jgi:WhiB family redox-sensing transcriptional regulator
MLAKRRYSRRSRSSAMTSIEYAPRPGVNNPKRMFSTALADIQPGTGGRTLSNPERTGVDGRPFETDAITPCRQTRPGPDNDLWFSPFRDKIHAIRACRECPFIGRCGYNAVVNRAQYGVWGGISLPGSDSTPESLEDTYIYLLAQFERRRPIELGDLPAPRKPSTVARRRRAVTTGHEPSSDSEVA